MTREQTESGFTISGRIDRRVHDVSELREQADNYDELTRAEKLELARDVEPVDEETVYNVTTDQLHEYFVRNLNPSNTAAQDNVDASWLGLGTDSASGTSTSDTDLNTRVYSQTVDSHSNNGKELLASTFIDSSSANGNTLDELGLFSGDPTNLGNADVFLLNHATFSAVSKDSSKTMTFDVTLTFSDV